MAACCGCCGALRPRYKRLVDNIFPADPQDGLVKSNMDKLTFFAMKSPEKLDRIGEYLAQRLSRDVSRQRYGFVVISMEALDTLLVTCHAHTLNMFVESFLKMVQKLLESNEPDMQCLATSSFVKFANIEEDTPSYHRRYDFFVSKFSSMCHSNHTNQETCSKLRLAGLKGLQGLVRKTVSDDLQVNLWASTHMDKIVPSLLFNMQDARGLPAGAESPRDEDHPSVVAETVFRDLVCRAAYGNIKCVIKPVLMHLDNHTVWVPNDFAVKCFKIIMYSVQAQYGHIVVQMLMSHLDENSHNVAKVKASIVDVLAETVLIAAGGSIGPSVLEVFNTLLRHLRVSVDSDAPDEETKNDELRVQEAIIDTIGEFAKNLPDYQKIEIMMFVMGKVPLPNTNSSSNQKTVLLQTMLMKTLLKVATKYQTVLMSNAFPSAFLEPLLRMSQNNDPGIRRIVQEILHTLLDRHNNQDKLKTVKCPKDIAQLNLNVEKPPRQDIIFMKKNGSLFYWHLYENMQLLNNRVDNFEALYCTMALLCVEMGGDDVLLELFRLALAIQQGTLESSVAITHKCAIQALVASYLNLISQLTAIPELCDHVAKVIENRQQQAPYYLPESAFNRSNTAGSYPQTDDLPVNLRFNTETLAKALSDSGHDVSLLDMPYFSKPSGLNDTLDLNKSASDIQSLSIDLESQASTPTSIRRSQYDEVTFESLKKALESNPRAKEEQDEQRLKIYETFKTGQFEDIVARSEAKSSQFHDKVNEILDMIAEPQSSPGGTPCKARMDEETIPIYEMEFPDLFVY